MLGWITSGWVLGLLLAPLCPSGWGLGLGVAALIASSVLVAYGEGLESGLWAVILSAMAFFAGLAYRTPAPPEVLAPGLVRMTARVEEVRFRRLEAIATVRVVESSRIGAEGALPPGATIDVLGADVPEGALVSVLGRLWPFTLFRNPSPHPPWPRTLAIGARLRPVEGSKVVVREAPWLRARMHQSRSAVRRALDRTLSPRAAGLARALVLGEGSSLGPEDTDAVRALGLSHVLAVSGLHVAVVAGMLVLGLERALRRAPRITDPRRVAAALGIPIAIVYAIFAGAAPSALRSAWTASIAFGLVALGRRPKPTAVLAAAVIGQSLLAPSMIRHPGLLLSVLSTVALLTSSPSFGSGPLAQMKAAAILSLRATIATLPLVLWLFGRVSIAGVLANVLLVPVGVALVPLSLGHGVLAALLPPLGALTAAPVDILSRAFLAACEAIAFEGAAPPLPPLSTVEGIALVVGCAALLFLRGRPRLGFVAAVCLVFCASEWHLRVVERPEGLLRATVLDVGQGDAVLVDMPDGRAILVDTGTERPDTGRAVLLPLLRARRRERIDVLVLTHPHPDHYGGLATLLEGIEVGELWDSGQAESESEGGPAAALLDAARARGIPVRSPAELCGRARPFGRARLDVLWPCPVYDAGYDPNDNSLVLRIAFGERVFLLVGDLERHGEAMLLGRRGELAADFLKVGHHGSRTSSTRAFLAAVHPRFAAISSGRFNQYGHPHPEPLEALAEAGARVLRTDHDGGITVTTDGHTLEVESFVESLRTAER